MAYKKLKYWFDRDLAILISKKIHSQYTYFNKVEFINNIESGIKDLELKDRVSLFADQLKSHLPDNYEISINILLNILGPENKHETGMFTDGYWIMPIAQFVEKFGLESFDLSMKAIKEITKRNTGEYCIRPFLNYYTEETLIVMDEWSKDINTHVRRLASEGLRPRLPWAKKLDMFIENPKPVVNIIDNLKDDSSRYVQKSVANNLNDILKDNYSFGMDTIRRWSKNAPTNRKWIIRHALRNQLKKANQEALSVLEDLNK